LKTSTAVEAIGPRMKRNQAIGFWRSAAQFVLGNIALALVTLLCFQLQLDLSTTAFTYLIIIMLETLDVFTRELLAIAEGQTSFQSKAVLQTLKGDKLTVLFEIQLPPEAATFDSVLVSIMDVTERKRAEEELHRAQSDLAHVTRVTTLGGLTASIAHEVNQPLTGIVTKGAACLRWLDQENPVLGETRRSVEDMINDAQRASEVIQEDPRAFEKERFEKDTPRRQRGRRRGDPPGAP
jgi:C4-dicarboxylate-specific signal transduction histidine kinase